MLGKAARMWRSRLPEPGPQACMEREGREGGGGGGGGGKFRISESYVQSNYRA